MPITLRDGSKAYVLKGEIPPQWLEGYIKDKTDPRIFRALHPPCKHRVEIPCAACGGTNRIDYSCKKLHKINFLQCLKCELREE